MFSTLCRTKIFIRSSFDLSSANAFNFNQQENSWFGYKVKRLNSLSNHKTLDQSKLEAFADDKINLIQRFKFVFGRFKIFGKEEKNAVYQHFLLFPQCFLHFQYQISTFLVAFTWYFVVCKCFQNLSFVKGLKIGPDFTH